MVAARLGVRSERDRDRLQAVMSALATLGPPEPSATREALERKLSSYMRVGGVRMGTGVTLRTCAAEALAVYDARQARELIRAAISSLGRGEADQREGRTLARILARFGDTSRIDSAALPVSETERETGDTFNRLYYQNQVGIDLLYARDFPRAILEFQRMLWSTPLSETASYNICCAYALDGDVDAALRWLRRAVRHAYRNPDHMRADPDLERLQGLPRFQRLLDQLTLEDEVGAPPAYSEWPSTVRPQ